jgi:hypothetical protein
MIDNVLLSLSYSTAAAIADALFIPHILLEAFTQIAHWIPRNTEIARRASLITHLSLSYSIAAAIDALFIHHISLAAFIQIAQ